MTTTLHLNRALVSFGTPSVADDCWQLGRVTAEDTIERKRIPIRSENLLLLLIEMEAGWELINRSEMTDNPRDTDDTGRAGHVGNGIHGNEG